MKKKRVVRNEREGVKMQLDVNTLMIETPPDDRETEEWERR